MAALFFLAVPFCRTSRISFNSDGNEDRRNAGSDSIHIDRHNSSVRCGSIDCRNTVHCYKSGRFRSGLRSNIGCRNNNMAGPRTWEGSRSNQLRRQHCQRRRSQRHTARRRMKIRLVCLRQKEAKGFFDEFSCLRRVWDFAAHGLDRHRAARVKTRNIAAYSKIHRVEQTLPAPISYRMGCFLKKSQMASVALKSRSTLPITFTGKN